LPQLEAHHAGVLAGLVLEGWELYLVVLEPHLQVHELLQELRGVDAVRVCTAWKVHDHVLEELGLEEQGGLTVSA